MTHLPIYLLWNIVPMTLVSKKFRTKKYVSKVRQQLLTLNNLGCIIDVYFK